ncbi:MAG: sulfite exporter TauE/SafE family protein [Chthoniobacteraceae bacterium]|nr:sulfite exporter TauE/SafE family protein [Chthoniobacteraceae bacterium]
MDFSHLTTQQWVLAAAAALLAGLAKSGFNGVGMLVMILMADAMRGHERESTGVVLPLLLCGDFFAARAFYRDVRWPMLLKLLPPAALGIGVGYFWMTRLDNTGFRPLIGGIVLALTALHLLRQAMPGPFQSVPQRPWFIWTMGTTAGATTMLANAAGPVVTLFFLAVGLPKMAFVATGALFFLIVNLMKTPFSFHLQFITLPSLVFNAMLVPLVALGLWGGRHLLRRIDQRVFERFLLVLTVLSALHLICA